MRGFDERYTHWTTRITLTKEVRERTQALARQDCRSLAVTIGRLMEAGLETLTAGSST